MMLDAPEWTFASIEALPHITTVPGLQQLTATYDYTNAFVTYYNHP